MPRKLILDCEWMRRARYNGWAVNYERRQFAQGLGDERCAQVLRVLDTYGFPMPVMELSGWLDKEASGLMISEKTREVCRICGLPVSEYESLARWYWSAAEWQVYVREFNDLPDPQGLYVFSWEGRFVPKVVPMGAVDNFGTSGGKSAFVPVPAELIARGLRQ